MKYMNWEDLEPGDKVIIRDEVIDIYKPKLSKYSDWTTDWGNRILEIVNVKLINYGALRCVRIVVKKTNNESIGIFDICVETGCEFTASAGGEFFKIIEVKPDFTY